MRYEWFNRLHQDKQLNIVMMLGVLLIECRRFNFTLRLFQISRFYVEIYSMEESGEIIAINAFDDLNSLDNYLDQVDISELVEN